jgi:hypothetical protein
MKNVLPKLIFVFSILSFFSLNAIAQATFTSRVSTGDWTSPASWSFTGTDSDGVPDADDNVTVTNNNVINVTTTVACLSLNINSGGRLVINGTNSLSIRGSFISSGSFSAGSGTVIFNGTGAQTIPSLNYANLTILNRSANVTLASGTIAVYGGFTAPATLTGGTYITTGNTLAFPGGNQTIPAFSYNNLTTSGSTKTLSGNITVNGNLTNTAVFNAGSFNISLAGNFSNSGTFNAGTSTITFNGTSNQSITGASTFYNLSLSKIVSGNVNLNSSIVINGTLSFTKGRVIAGSNSVRINGIITGGSASTGFVEGNLTKAIASGNPTVLFEVGTGSNYTPLNMSFTSVTSAGLFTVSSTSSDHPNISTSGLNAARSVNRYWTITNSNVVFANYSVVATFVTADLDPSANSSFFNIQLLTAGVWSSQTTVNRLATSTQATGVTIPLNGGTSVLQIGEGAYANQLYSITSGNWTTPGVWSNVRGGAPISNIPTADDQVFIEGGHTITMNGAPGLAKALVIGSVAGSGTALFLSASTTNVGTGGITISSNGNLTGSAAGVLTTTGGLIANNSSLSNSNSIIRLQTNSGQTIAGIGTIANLDVLAATTNIGTLTVNNILSGNSSLTQGSNSTLNVGNTLSIATLNATTNFPNSVNYIGTGAQTIKNTGYDNLTISNRSANVTLASGTISVYGSFTAPAALTSGSYITTGNTFAFLGTSSQTIPAFPYNNIITSGGTKTLGGNITVNGNLTNAAPLNAGSFNISVGGDFSTTSTFSAGSGTVIFNGTGAQTIPAFNYANLTILNRSANVTLASGTIAVYGGFTAPAILTSGSYITTGNTLAFPNGPQAIPAFPYNNLTTSGDVKTLAGNIIVNGNLTNSAPFNAGSFNINLAGNFSNSGTFNAGVGTVTFTGAGSQSILGNNANFYNINKTGPGTLNFSSSQSLINSLKASAGTINANGNLTLLSTATSTARIGNLTGVTFNGNIIVQRFIPGGRRGYRHLAPPVQDFNFTQMKDNIFITGQGNEANGFEPAPYTTIPSAHTYNNAANTNNSWVDVPNINTQVATGQGFRVLIRGDRTQVNSLEDPAVIPNNVLLDFVGVPRVGNVAYNIAYGPGTGWNLVGNPYPSPIDWESPGWTRTSNVSTIYTWISSATNPNVGKYATYTLGGTSTNGGSRYIESCQGFFVKVSAAGPTSLSSSETVKTDQNAANYFRIAAPVNEIKILLKNEDEVDEGLIRFVDQASKSFDEGLDVHKLDGNYMNLSSVLPDGTSLAVNALPLLKNDEIIPLRVTVEQKGNYELSFAGSESLTEGISLQLKDHYVNKLIDVSAQSSYPFVISSDVNSYGNDRFELLVRTDLAKTYEAGPEDVATYPNPNTGSFTLSVNKMNEGLLEWELYDGLGRAKISKTYQHAERNFIEKVDVSDLSKGVYILKVKMNHTIISKRVVVQ